MQATRELSAFFGETLKNQNHPACSWYISEDEGKIILNVEADLDPADVGLIDVQGNELTRHHHMGSSFNDHNGTATEVESFEATAEKDGIVMLFHPGRYY